MNLISSMQEVVKMGKQSGSKDIRIRIQEAEMSKDRALVSDILDEATKEEANMLVPIIPDLLKHPDWLVRASAVERVGASGLRQFEDLVRERLKDRVINVRAYALMAYYDLLARESLPVVEEFCRAKNVGLRVTALALHYVETHKEDVWKALTRILKRRNCYYMHRHIVLNVFEHYLDVSRHPEIVDLFQGMLRDLPRWHGLYKDIKQCLRVWRPPVKRKQKKK